MDERWNEHPVFGLGRSRSRDWGTCRPNLYKTAFDIADNAHVLRFADRTYGRLTRPRALH